MRKEDVKEGMKVLVKSSTYDPSDYTMGMVGLVVEVRSVDDDGTVSLWADCKRDYWWFNLSDIEPAEASQAPSVTINGTVYVPEDTIKAPEPAPAPKFFWGQWVNVEGMTQAAIIIRPAPDCYGEIAVLYAGRCDWSYCAASRCTPIGA